MSKIDWKKVAASPGYRSLKAAYQRELDENDKRRQRGQRPMRDKAEFLKKFNWVINRAKHYSHHLNKPIEDILTEWEEKRDYWWLNYYQESRHPKFTSKSLKPMGINGVRKYYKKTFRCDEKTLRLRISKFLNFRNPERTKKARWTALQHRIAKRKQNL